MNIRTYLFCMALIITLTHCLWGASCRKGSWRVAGSLVLVKCFVIWCFLFLHTSTHTQRESRKPTLGRTPTHPLPLPLIASTSTKTVSDFKRRFVSDLRVLGRWHMFFLPPTHLGGSGLSATYYIHI